MQTTINTPEGTKDRLFSECETRRHIQGQLTELFTDNGYSEISTPEFEYYDLFVQSGNPIPQESMLKIIDRSGKIMVMRPDCTTPIARVVATKLSNAPLPQKLYYNETVFRSGIANKGGKSEIAQCGIELIGAEGKNADIEALKLALSALNKVCPHGFHLEIGHSGLFSNLIKELKVEKNVAEQVRSLIEGKQFAALRKVLESNKGSRAYTVLTELSELFGGVEILEKAEKLLGRRDELEYLKSLYDELEKAGLSQFVRFDLGLVHQIGYYTGIVFRGYMEGAGAPILSGGRYDNLMGDFGREAAAIGFACDVDAVAECSEIETGTAHRLKIAMTKGRLLDKSVALFESFGMDCENVKNPGRKLVLEINNYPLDVVLAKAPDVTTYVEHGVCDLGIVGKDTLLEQEGKFYEVLDLGIGKCRFALAVKKGTDFYGTYKTRRIATKYPNVTRKFFEQKGMDVEIIKIEGSVELAPILGLADGIVDIVETGATLKENGLIPIETVAEVSARLIVNTAAMKLYKDDIEDFVKKCRKAVEG